MDTLTLTIDLQELKNNILKIKKSVPHALFLLPVKANAYGHGIVEITKYTEKEKLADIFGVAKLSEALELRKTGITTEILIMSHSFFSTHDLCRVQENNISIVVSSIETLKKCKNFPGLKIHLSVDTGMGREGMFPEEIPQALKIISPNSLAGIMTHFAVSDESDEESKQFTQIQIENFKKIKTLVKEQYPEQKICFHSSNSGGTLNHPSSIFNMIRPGIAVYGYPEGENSLNLQPVMHAHSYIDLIKTYPKDHSIGYGRTYQTSENERIGIIPVGYGDGLFRNLSGKISPFINGKYQPSCGRISMDQFAISLDKNDTEGDRVEIIGLHCTAQTLANHAGTISYEILCNLGNGPRAEKVYNL